MYSPETLFRSDQYSGFGIYRAGVYLYVVNSPAMFRQLRIYRNIKALKFEKALSLFPSEEKMTATLLVYRAHIFFKTFQYEMAKRDLDKVKQMGKQLYSAFNNQGYFYLYQNRFDEAIVELQEAKKLQPRHSFAINNLGFAYMMTNKIEEGVKLVEEALKLDRHNYYTIRNIGVYYLLKKQYTDALVVFNKARDKDKSIEDIDHYIAICQLKCGDTEGFSEQSQRLSSQEKQRLENIRQIFP